MLIDKEYFVGEILIPNLESFGRGISLVVSEANRSGIDLFIAKYERKFLVDLLGVKLYRAFMDGLQSGDVKREWVELKAMLVDETCHLSPIANYVYYWFTRNRITESTGVGEVVGQVNNATVVSPAEKMVLAWNLMVDEVKVITSWLEGHEEDYVDFCPNFKAEIFFKINTLGV